MIKRKLRLITLSALLLGNAATTQADNLYVVNDRTYGAYGNTITKLATNGTATLFASGFYAGGLAFDQSGNLYVGTTVGNVPSGGTIIKFAPDGTRTVFASGLNYPVGLAFDRSGNLWVGDQYDRTLTKIAPDGTPTLFPTGLVLPYGLAIDPSGNLYLSDLAGGTITKFAPDGTPTVFASGLYIPTGLAVDRSGNLYAGSWDRGTITKFTPDGTPTLFASGVSGNHAGLAFDRNGILYLAQQGNNTIKTFDAAGNDLGVFVSTDVPGWLAFDYFLPGETGMSITSQPKRQVRYWGQDVSFSVAVTNATPPVAYRWRKDSAPLLDATNATLLLTNLQLANAGSYDVVVTDAMTTLTSLPATLTVNPAGVAIALYAGVTIDGVPNRTYGIQSTTDLNNTNSWVAVANVTLSGPKQIWYDSQPATLPQRFYRVVPGPISIP